MSWSREQVRILLNEYKRRPCLYAVKSKLYTNKHAKQTALQEIATVLEEKRPGTTIAEIRTKFTGLKATFLTEYRKYRDSLGTGTAEDEIYHPTLWYYEDLTFVLDHCDPRPSVDSIEEVDSELMESTMDDSETTTYIVNSESGDLQPENSDNSRPSTSHSVYGNKEGKKTVKKKDKTDPLIQAATNTLDKISSSLLNHNKTYNLNTNNNDSEDHILGQFIVSKLKNIVDGNVRLEVEGQIIDLLYQGIKQSKQNNE